MVSGLLEHDRKARAETNAALAKATIEDVLRTAGTSAPALETIRRTVAIVGFAPSRVQAPYDDPTVEIWGVNELAGHVPRVDVLFELHDEATLQKEEQERKHLTQLAQFKGRIYMHRAYPEIPSSVAYPLETIVAQHGRYFTNSISYMIALAIEQGFTAIQIFGVDMAMDGEYSLQKPSCEYFIGYARGRGISVFIPDNSDLCKTAFLYGFEQAQADAFKTKLITRRDWLTNQRTFFLGEIRKMQSAYDQFEGAVTDTEHYLKNWT